MSNWHQNTVDHVVQHMQTEKSAGISESEARLRLIHYGPNELIEKKSRGPVRIFFAQFLSTLVLVLMASSLISAILGDVKNFISIGAIILLNAVFGFIQENRAEKALVALKKLAVPTVKVRRNAQIVTVSARELVPGDVVILEVGNAVPADGRIIESVNFQTQESALTGESQAVEKNSACLSQSDIPLAERSNMVYAGTIVTRGRGAMVVTETGMSTELGRIAAMIQSVNEEVTPLQKRLDHLGNRLALAALVVVGVIFALGLLRGESFRLMLMTAVSIAVAAVPEGLPAIVTISLALGTQRMLRRNALIRRLPAVETLGCVTAICTDKTGTLTENKMTVAFLDVANLKIDLRNAHAERTKGISSDALQTRQALDLLLIGGALCNDSFLETNSNSSHLQATGDPTETALALAAWRFGFPKSHLELMYPRVAEFPFDSVLKRMVTIHKLPSGTNDNGTLTSNGKRERDRYILFVKGAVDSIMGLSNHLRVDGSTEKMQEDWRRRIRMAQDDLAQSGMRVLGVAYRVLDADVDATQISRGQAESDLTFIGLLGLMDPLRQEVKHAVKTCLAAGIKPVMITGDHPLTAKSIAEELGFSQRGVLTGVDLDRLSTKDFEAAVDHVSIYARVSPEHKLNIVQALQNCGQVVAMTGDGVNDAPALKKADIGVAMGIAGTDVAKEAADMVLLDDNFATIVAAVKEGRVIYDNIRKFVKYLLTTNSAEILVMLIAPLLGMPLPLLPLQILWINLVTDGPAALALSLESAERDVMSRAPIRPNEKMIGRGMVWHVVWVGILMTTMALAGGFPAWQNGRAEWQTLVFTSLTFCQMAHVMAIRSERTSLFQQGVLSNPWLLGAVVATIGSQFILVYNPLMQEIFHTVSLTPYQVGICISSAGVIFIAVEIEKCIKRRRLKSI